MDRDVGALTAAGMDFMLRPAEELEEPLDTVTIE